MTGPLISLLSDFGAARPVGAIMRGVVLGIAPDARIVDISHEVRKYAIRDGALLLWCALPYLPVGFHVAVVDPGVGTARLPVAIATDRGDVLIGPDNGLLVGGRRTARRDRRGPRPRGRGIPPARRQHELPRSRHLRPGRRPPRPRRRDRRARTGARSGGARPVADPRARGPRRRARLERRLRRHVRQREAGRPAGRPRGGTRAADARRSAGARRSRAGARSSTTWQATFGDVAIGETLVYEDSYGRICLAASQANAAELHGLVEDLEVSIRRG